MKPKETFDFQIRKSWIALSKMYNEQVAQYGLTVAMGFALLNIDIKKGTPSTSLGPKMGMESTSLRETCDVRTSATHNGTSLVRAFKILRNSKGT